MSRYKVTADDLDMSCMTFSVYLPKGGRLDEPTWEDSYPCVEVEYKTEFGVVFRGSTSSCVKGKYKGEKEYRESADFRMASASMIPWIASAMNALFIPMFTYLVAQYQMGNLQNAMNELGMTLGNVSWVIGRDLVKAIEISAKTGRYPWESQ